MLSFFRKPVVSAPVAPSCPVGPAGDRRVPMTKINATGATVFDESIFPKVETCYRILKESKKSDKRFDHYEIFSLIDTLKTHNEAKLVGEGELTNSAYSNFVKKIETDTEHIRKTVKNSGLLTDDEKAIIYQYIYGLGSFYTHMIRLKHRAVRANAMATRRANNATRRNTNRKLREAERAVREAKRLTGNSAPLNAALMAYAEPKASAGAGSKLHRNTRRNRRTRRYRR